MKGGGGNGSSTYTDGDINKARTWWGRGFRTRSSMAILGPSSYSPRGGGAGRGDQLRKAAIIMAIAALLLSAYQSYVSHRFASPLWLSFSFVSRPSLLLATQDLPHMESSRTPPAATTTTTIIPLPPVLEGHSPSHLQPSDELPASRRPVHSFADEVAPPTMATHVGSQSPNGDDKYGDRGDERTRSNVTDFDEFSIPKDFDYDGDSTKAEEKDNSLQRDVNVTGPLVKMDEELSNSETKSSQLSPNVPVVIRHSPENSSLPVVRDIERVSSVDSTPVVLEGGEIRSVEQEAKDDVDGVSKEPVELQRGSKTSNHSQVIGIPGGDDEGTPRLTEEDLHDVFQKPSMEKRMDERWLSIEQELLVAKHAIDAATDSDSDPTLYRHIYRNVSAFSKSYKLMEEMFRIYVYREGDKRLVHTGPMLGIYCSEGQFIYQLRRGSWFVERDPYKAHMFFLPYSVTEMSLKIYVEGSHSMAPLNNFVTNYVNEVAAKYPFWNRSRGADHFFVSCHDWGPATARDHEELRTNAMKIVCNADLREEFVLGKDASLPEIYLHNHRKVKVGGPGASRRSILAFFAGQLHGHVRPILMDYWKDKDPDMKIYEVLPKEIERKMNYIEHMKNSKYCICAAGYEVNSPRIVESIYYGCVPVIIADNFVLPFDDVLNWSAFSIILPELDIPNLKSILLNVPEKQYRTMQGRLAKVRQHFMWNIDPVKYDVFHMILHSIWTSRLNRLNLTLTDQLASNVTST